MVDRYETGRTILRFSEIVGWLLVAGGVIGGMQIAAQPGPMSLRFGLLVGATFAMGGLLLVLLAQIARAQIETALNTRDFLSWSRHKSDTAEREAKQPNGSKAGAPDKLEVGESVDYRGHTIRRTQSGYEVDDTTFMNAIRARKHIDRLQR